MKQYLNSPDGKRMVGRTSWEYAKEYDEARAKTLAKLKEALANRESIDIGTSPTSGSLNSPITLVEFIDFQCGYCDEGRRTISELLEKYPNTFLLVVKHVNFFGEESERAARSALAANEQGKYWEMYDLLFDNRTNLNESLYVRLAERLNLDPEKFVEDFRSKKVSTQLHADSTLSSKVNIDGTPVYFFNGVRIDGTQPTKYFELVVGALKKERE
ncbi:MAG: thioredoxin domain-containing protein [Bdellovibrionales bacterium]|nr:thioredoxin domain-containing protein [Bdellovibrionales bacterium]